MIRRLLANAAALAVATYLLHGITVSGSGLLAQGATLLAVSLIFGLLNVLVKPVLRVVSCPITCLTLGLFVFVINAVMLVLTSWVCGTVGVGFHVDGWWSAFWGSIIVSVVSALVGGIAQGAKQKD